MSMNNWDPQEGREATIRDLFPDFTEEQLALAEKRLRDYLAFTVRLYDSIRADPVRFARLKELLEQRRKERTQKFDSPRGSVEN